MDIAVPVAVTATVQSVGFGAAGVVAGTTASGIQANMGGIIVKGSAFAICQSIGATGSATIGSMFLPVALTVGVGYEVYKYFTKTQKPK